MDDNYTVYITQPATYDLYYIKNYLDGYSTSLFISFYLQIKEKIKQLKKYPYMFEVLHINETSMKYRRFFIKNYIIIYEVNENKKIIIIDRILHSKEDYKSIIMKTHK